MQIRYCWEHFHPPKKLKFGETLRRVYWSRRPQVTWESFWNDMKKQYIPEAARDKKQAEIHDWCKGT